MKTAASWTNMYPITHCNNYATGSFTAKIEIKGSRGIINDHEYTKKKER